MGEDVTVRQEVGSVAPDRGAQPLILVMNLPRRPEERSVQIGRRQRRFANRGRQPDLTEDPLHRPAQIDGGRAGGEERGVGVGEGGVGRIRAECEPQAPRRGGTDQRGPAHQHSADGVGRIIESGEASGDERMR